MILHVTLLMNIINNTPNISIPIDTINVYISLICPSLIALMDLATLPNIAAAIIAPHANNKQHIHPAVDISINGIIPFKSTAIFQNGL